MNWKEIAVADLPHFRGIYLDKTKENHRKSQYFRCPGLDSNRTPPEYMAIVLLLDQSAYIHNVVAVMSDIHTLCTHGTSLPWIQ